MDFAVVWICMERLFKCCGEKELLFPNQLSPFCAVNRCTGVISSEMVHRIWSIAASIGHMSFTVLAHSHCFIHHFLPFIVIGNTNCFHTAHQNDVSTSFNCSLSCPLVIFKTDGQLHSTLYPCQLRNIESVKGQGLNGVSRCSLRVPTKVTVIWTVGTGVLFQEILFLRFQFRMRNVLGLLSICTINSKQICIHLHSYQWSTRGGAKHWVHY